MKRTILKLLQLRSALFSRQSPCCQSTFNEITSDAIPKNHCFSTATRCNQTHCCIYVLQRKLVPESYNIYFMNLHLRRFICISIESAWRGIGEVYSICSLCLGYMQVVVEAISMLTWSEYAIDLTILLLMQRTAFIWKIIQMRDFFLVIRKIVTLYAEFDCWLKSGGTEHIVLGRHLKFFSPVVRFGKSLIVSWTVLKTG